MLSRDNYLTKLVFQEVKTGVGAKSINNANEKELGKFIHELNNDKVKFEHWAREKDTEPFELVLHPNIWDETNEPEYLKNHKYCPKCGGYYLTDGHWHFNPPPIS